MGFNITIIHKKGIIERVMKKTIMLKYFITSKMLSGGLHFFRDKSETGKDHCNINRFKLWLFHFRCPAESTSFPSKNTDNRETA